MNRRDAAFLLAHRYPGGLEAVAARLGKRADTLRKELTGANGYKWGVDDEEMLIALCQSAGVDDALAPITAAAVNAGAMLLPLPSAGSDSGVSFQHLAEAAREFGEFVAASAKAEADGRVTARELRQIERESADLVAKVQLCVARALKIHETGKPAHLREVGPR